MTKKIPKIIIICQKEADINKISKLSPEEVDNVEIKVEQKGNQK